MAFKKGIKFEDLGLSKFLLSSLFKMGFETPTQIQSKAIPMLQEGCDLIAQASTGTGKTLAFGIPGLEGIDIDDKSVQVLVMCPTRELAVQVSNELIKLKGSQKLYVTPVYGGQEIGKLLNSLKKGSHVVVGTPGRLMDHIRRKSIDLSSIEVLVLECTASGNFAGCAWAQRINQPVKACTFDNGTLCSSEQSIVCVSNTLSRSSRRRLLET